MIFPQHLISITADLQNAFNLMNMDFDFTGINGGFSGSHRHVRSVGHQCCSLHNALHLPIHLHGQLLDKTNVNHLKLINYF